MSEPINIFISYAQKDRSFMEEIRKSLRSLEEDRICKTFADNDIQPGEDSDYRIRRELERADIILPLVSSDYVASDYLNKVEMEEAIHRYRREEVMILPIFIRATDWHSLPFSLHQVLPKDGISISSHQSRDAFWNWDRNISAPLRETIKKIASGKIRLRKPTPIIQDKTFAPEFIENISSILSRGENEYALEVALKYSKTYNHPVLPDIVRLKSQFDTLSRQYSQGDLSLETYNKISKKIIQSLEKVIGLSSQSAEFA